MAWSLKEIKRLSLRIKRENNALPGYHRTMSELSSSCNPVSKNKGLSFNHHLFCLAVNPEKVNKPLEPEIQTFALLIYPNINKGKRIEKKTSGASELITFSARSRMNEIIDL